MRRAPRRCACGHTVQPGKACPCQIRRGYSAEGKRPSAHRRGYTREWAAKATAFLARPENRMCACGCGKRAEMVDHKHGRAGTLMMDPTNWQPMTIACNSRKNAKHEGGFGNSCN